MKASNPFFFPVPSAAAGPSKQEERERYGGGGTGPLRHIASAYLQPDQLVGGLCGGRKVVAFAITLTKEGNHLDGAAVLAASIGVCCKGVPFVGWWWWLWPKKMEIQFCAKTNCCIIFVRWCT